jgi:hypothetical protein
MGQAWVHVVQVTEEAGMRTCGVQVTEEVGM